jgi:alpha-beta hydrolase superfamily lysophospholipase
LVASDEDRARKLARSLDAGFENPAILAKDGAVLRAWSLLPHRGNGNSVILLHGLGDNRMGMIGYAELLLSHGYGILMPDSRAHGQSGGKVATYGLLERD